MNGYETDAGLTVADAALRGGVTVSAVRYYLRQGLLLGHRDRRGRWALDPSTPERLRFLRAAQDHGLTLPEIAALLDPVRGATRRRALAAEAERRIVGLRRWQDVLETGPGQVRGDTDVRALCS